jgi:DNA-binding transcriptional ArsR family regulator
MSRAAGSSAKSRASTPVRSSMTPKQAASCCRPVDDLLDPTLFKVLSDPTRLTLLGCMIKCGRACSVGEVAECCSVDLSVVSRHLQALARAGLAVPSRTGRTVAYAVQSERLCASLRALADAIEDCAPPRRSVPARGACVLARGACVLARGACVPARGCC